MSNESRTKKIIIDVLGGECAARNPEALGDELNLSDDLGADSLDEVEIIMAIEEEFGLMIPDEEAETFKTVGDIVEYVEKVA